MQNTAEQDNIVEAANTGDSVLIEAGAGCGKTTSLKQIARAKPKRTHGYLAYNRAIADDAKGSFPRNTTAKTGHGFAMAAVGHKLRHKLDMPFVSNKAAASILGINNGVKYGDGEDGIYYSPEKLARLAIGTVGKYCQSADREVSVRNVPWIPGAEDYFSDLAAMVAPYAQKAWEDLSAQNGKLRFTHDIYLKLWSLSDPELPFEVILFDEAQDANPVIEHVVKIQDAQIIMVGDSAQQIYAWRGAEDAMGRFNAAHRLTLSQSFRFGQAVADEANKWLELIDAPLRLKGWEKINSEVTTLDEPHAILCRTNAGVISGAIHCMEENRSFAVVGGTDQIKALARGARDLMSGQGSSHPDLMGFKNWSAVQEYVREEGGDLKVLVNLVDTYGIEKILEIADRAVQEKYAKTIISTAHKAKGREWDSVRVNTDFQEPVDPDTGEPTDPIRAECMLSYVTVTRAQKQLDRGGLAWVDKHVGKQQDERPIPRALRRKRARNASVGEA